MTTIVAEYLTVKWSYCLNYKVWHDLVVCILLIIDTYVVHYKTFTLVWSAHDITYILFTAA